eukprot:gnl/TRDRNA2_/TRDRNA2_168189_c3_seq2.p1 gnl/TRDRNA2_/TRDRNA2_168189_c3~~gnl/TRDRNA2_/TRDRNA2_168189_c3_seq2.p1  ORF type:complete len:299 (+),score=71.82 gnl/TRDRNA2_/TRDRNA2_168189_c3_seq2:80-898(+)
MGFEPDIRKIIGECPKTGEPKEGGGASGPLAGSMRQTLFFTATWPKAVKEIAASLTSKAALQVRIGQGAGGDRLTANSSVTQEVIVCDPKEKLAKVKELLAKELGANETGIVFSATKGGCDMLERELPKAGDGKMWCKAIHGDKEQWQREETLEQFRRLLVKGERGILVATDVASRGLDIPGVALVLVFDFGRGKAGMNSGVESYVHRIGRTGRAGKTGRAFTYFTSEDTGAPELVKLLRDAKQKVPPALVKMSDDEWYAKQGKKKWWGRKW